MCVCVCVCVRVRARACVINKYVPVCMLPRGLRIKTTKKIANERTNKQTNNPPSVLPSTDDFDVIIICPYLQVEGHGSFVVQVVDSVIDYVELIKEIFDFQAIKRLFAGDYGFSMIIDSMHGGEHFVYEGTGYFQLHEHNPHTYKYLSSSIRQFH